jgi:hypothetical protein
MSTITVQHSISAEEIAEYQALKSNAVKDALKNKRKEVPLENQCGKVNDKFDGRCSGHSVENFDDMSLLMILSNKEIRTLSIDNEDLTKKIRLYEKDIAGIKILNDDMSMSLLSTDKEIIELKSKNSKLTHKNKLFKSLAKNVKKYHSSIIKKDKLIHKLRESIKNDFINFGETMTPKSYLRISKRFPHLTLPEIIDFEKKIRKNGGSIQTHSGDFILTKRIFIQNSNSKDHCYGTFISWNCCHSLVLWYSGQITCVVPNVNMRGIISERYREIQSTIPKCGKCLIAKCSLGGACRDFEKGTYLCGAVDLTNRIPDSKCDFPKTFYLNEEDEKTKDIKEVLIKDVSISISHNVNVLEQTIEEYSEKIIKLKRLQENLDLLVNI